MLRRTLVAALVAPAGAALPIDALAQGKTTRLVVSFPPGGPVDFVARALAEGLGKELVQSVIVDNKAGANGAIGAGEVARSTPDGSTLWLTSVGAAAVNPSLYEKLAYDMARDFAPVSLVVNNVELLVVNPADPAHDAAEFVANSKKKKDPTSMASSGIGSIPHLRCCCASMTDILTKYKDPAATGKLSAHIFVEHGIAEAITGDNGRTDTWVTMHSTDPAGITLHGTAGSSSFSIVFDAGAQFAILNNTVSTPTTPPHFLAYYLMGVGSSSCTSVPSDGPPCAPQEAECVISSAMAKKQAASAKRRAVALQAIRKPRLVVREVDSNCSNSHWP